MDEDVRQVSLVAWELNVSFLEFDDALVQSLGILLGEPVNGGTRTKEDALEFLRRTGILGRADRDIYRLCMDVLCRMHLAREEGPDCRCVLPGRVELEEALWSMREMSKLIRQRAAERSIHNSEAGPETWSGDGEDLGWFLLTLLRINRWLARRHQKHVNR